MWLSSISTNHCSHSSHITPSRSRAPTAWARPSRATGEATPSWSVARMNRRETAISRREKWPYIVGRKLISRAINPRPISASKIANSRVGRSPVLRTPSVVIDEPLRTSASRYGRTSSAQNMAENPATTSPAQASGRTISENGAYRAITASTSAGELRRREMASNTTRIAVNTIRPIRTRSPRGTTTVRTADASTPPTTKAPTTNTTTSTTTMTAGA